MNKMSDEDGNFDYQKFVKRVAKFLCHIKDTFKKAKKRYLNIFVCSLFIFPQFLSAQPSNQTGFVSRDPAKGKPTFY